jgi:hypothetical protein
MLAHVTDRKSKRLLIFGNAIAVSPNIAFFSDMELQIANRFDLALSRAPSLPV